MDEDKGGGHDETRDPIDHSNHNKVTPAVADEAFLAEEDEVERNMPPPPPPPSQPQPFQSVQNAGGVSLPGTSGTGQNQSFDFVERGFTFFFLGGLHWWTTDTDIEFELCKYGEVRDLRMYLYKDCGKSKGYCKVEFYDPLAAVACMEGLEGHKFNGRPCVVSLTRTPFLDKNQPDVDNQGKKAPSKGYRRGNWGRGNRGHGNLVWNRVGGMGGRSIGMGGSVGRMGGAAPQMLSHPWMGGYAGFPGVPITPFPGILPSQPGVGLRGLAPYGNYSFYGSGMPRHGTGMIPPSGMGGPNMGMRQVSDMGRLGGEEPGGGKVAEASYKEEAASDHQNDEVNRDRGDLADAMREKDRGLEKDLPGTSERMFKDDRFHEFDSYESNEYDSEHDYEDIGNLGDRKISRARTRDSDVDRERSRSRDHVPDSERGLNRDRNREDRGRNPDHHGFIDQAPQRNDEQERGRSSRPSIKSRLSYPTRNYSHNGKRR